MQEKTVSFKSNQNPQMNKQTKREILLVSGVLGLCTLLFTLIGTGVSTAFTKLIQSGTLANSCSDYYLAQIIYTLVSLLPPFFLGSLVIRKIQKKKKLVTWGHAEDRVLFGLSIAFGFLALILANAATGIMTKFFAEGGVTFDDPELPMPKTLPEYLLLVIASVIVPAFVEEFAFRGVVLQSFRKYGDLFAVGMSSLLFACMHGNMTQMPFALILGVVMGILVVATDSIWTGIAIHLFNNTYAVCLTLISDNCSQMVAYTSTVLINFFGLALGLGACVFASRYYRGARAKKLYAPGGNTKKEQRKYHAQAWLYSLLSLPMLVAIALLIFNLYVSVHTGGTT